ncbi:MAG: hypothetical protein EOO19_11855 [Chryseobacterium sp.]|nr:MAG: hypothetical protein EOO19_11855 [Chryseobacterium sp.]
MENQNWNNWTISAKKALDWFISYLGEEEWTSRRLNVAEYFHSLKAVKLSESDVQNGVFEKLFSPIAVYTDWISWYMYLVESNFIRPGCDDPFQSSRTYPFFALIGDHIEALEKMSGINERLSVMFNEKQNQPDSTLFELGIAILYHRNGWQVSFLKEVLERKTPDLSILKDGITIFVECKRFSKVTGYAEQERAEWQKRSKHLFNSMRILKRHAHAEITFKVPIEETDEIILGAAFHAYVKLGKINNGLKLSNNQIDFYAKDIDIDKFNERLSAYPYRPNSPNIIDCLLEGYDMHGNYTNLIAPKEIVSIKPEDRLYILNDFYSSVYDVYSAKWECIAKSSVDKKAKDIKKILSKAVSQIPDNAKGIIHIAYETLSGPEVEVVRNNKTYATINSFDFRGKNIISVYCHALQLSVTPNGPDWSETTIFFEKEISNHLKENLLFNFPEPGSGLNTS